MTYLIAMYPHKDISEETIRGYKEQLASKPSDVLLEAAKRIVGNVGRPKFFPLPAEILEVAEEIEWLAVCKLKHLDPETGLRIWPQ